MSEEDYKSVGEIKNQWVETKDEYLDMALNVIDNLKIKNKQLEDIIEEVRKYIERKDICIDIRDEELNCISTNELLQILDKVGDNNG